MIDNPLDVIIEKFNTLDLDNQEYLFDILHKQIIDKKREQLIEDIRIAELNFASGNFKRGSVSDLISEIEND